MGQLEPGAGEGVGEGRRIIAEALGNLAILGVEFERHVGIRHHGFAADRRILHIHRHILFSDIDRFPLMGPRRRFLQPPVVLEQQLEVAVVPLGRVGGPGPFDAAGHSVAADAAAVVIDPTQPLLFEAGPFRLGAKLFGVAVAVSLADGVATGGQCHRLFVIHRHAGEGDPHILRGFQRIGLAIHPFRVDVDKPHHHRRQRVFQIPLAGVTTARLAAGRQPLLLRSPVDILLRMPDILAAKGEAEGLEPHGLIGHGARQNNQIGPADLVAVLLLDGP